MDEQNSNSSSSTTAPGGPSGVAYANPTEGTLI
jgi:hypothetical protein